MGHSIDGERSAFFRNQRFLLCCCAQCDPAHRLDSRDADRLWPGSRCHLQILRIFKPQPLDHSLWSDHNPVGCGGSSILEVAPTNLRPRSTDFMHRPDLYRLSRVWLGDALPNSEKKRFPFYGRNGSCDCHAHLVASLGFGLFALCHRFEKKFLGDLDRVFHCLLLDVSHRPDGHPCHPITGPFWRGDESHVEIWMGHPCADHRPLLYFHHHFFRYLFYGDLGPEYFPKLGERTGIWIGGILGIIVAIIFPTLLNYEHFLLFIGAMFCPLFGIVLVDYFLIRRGVIDLEDLYKREGKYWFSKGINPLAIIAWAIGFGIYLGFSPMLMEKVLQVKAAFPWPLGSSLPSMILAGLIYWFFRKQIAVYKL